MGKESENYLDSLLNSVSGTTKEDDFEIDDQRIPLGYTARDEEDFLKEFEKELSDQDYLEMLDDIQMDLDESDEGFLEEGKKSLDDVLNDIENHFSGGNVQEIEGALDDNVSDSQDIALGNDIEENSDLSDLMEETDLAGEPSFMEESVSENDTLLQDEGAIQDEEALGDEVPLGEDVALTEDGEVDLAGISDDDLMDLLANDEDLSDLGDLLSEKGESEEALDAIEEFASNEMQEQEKEQEQQDKKSKKEKKGGFFAKLAKLFFGDDEEAEGVVIKNEEGATASQLSEENQKILAELNGSKRKEEKRAQT